MIRLMQLPASFSLDMFHHLISLVYKQSNIRSGKGWRQLLWRSSRLSTLLSPTCRDWIKSGQSSQFPVDHFSEEKSLSKWKDLDLQASTQWTNMISPLTRLPDTQKSSNPEQTALRPNFLFLSIVCGLDHPEFSWLYFAQLWTAMGTKGHPDHHAFEKEDDDIYIMMKCVSVCNEKWALS